jgi:phasin
MTEAIETTTSKSKAKAVSPTAFDMPKFEIPNFEIPKMEIPAAFREIAEKSVSQAKETYEKMKSAAEEATDVLEDTYAAATKGASDYGLKVIEAARANTNAAFDFASQLMTVKSLSEMVELSTAHTRKQFETLTAQSKELAAIAQKVAVDSAEPVKQGVQEGRLSIAIRVRKVALRPGRFARAFLIAADISSGAATCAARTRARG